MERRTRTRQKMPRREPPESILGERIMTTVRRRGQLVADMLGPAPGTEDVDTAKAVDMYYYRKPGVDAVALVQQGMSPEEATGEAYPFRMQMLLAAGSEQETDKRIAFHRQMARMSGEASDAMAISHPMSHQGEPDVTSREAY
jgi:hypothetical protein